MREITIEEKELIKKQLAKFILPVIALSAATLLIKYYG